MAVNDDQPRLGCGRLADDVWAHASDPPDAHELGCPFCQRARTNLQALSEAAEDLAGHEDQDPAYTPSSRVKDFVMQLVHLELRRGQPIPLLVPDPLEAPATLTISEQAVLDLIWRAADQVPGLRARHCSVRVHPADQQPGRPGAVHVDVHLTVAAGTAIPDLAATLRDRLRDAIAAQTGLATRRITLTVEDLYDA